MEGGHSQVYRGSLSKLVDKINTERGIDLSHYRQPYLERRIAARLRALELHSYRQYADALDSDPHEYQELLNTITINVTDFFRDRPVWDIVRKDVLAQLIAEKGRGRSRTIRVWSAGCATGEEPYSVAMLLHDLLGNDVSRFLIGINATDLDDQALATAERGVYDVARLRHIPPSYQVRFTNRIGYDRFEMKPEVRRLVRFSHFSLFDESPMRVVDLILCRNVFIYFDREQQAKALSSFWQSMARGGYLVLGRSEKLSPEMTARLEPVEAKERVYRKPARP